jgi:hypothetical protein
LVIPVVTSNRQKHRYSADEFTGVGGSSPTKDRTASGSKENIHLHGVKKRYDLIGEHSRLMYSEHILEK